jgi:multiple sugar transport system permease protein
MTNGLPAGAFRRAFGIYAPLLLFVAFALFPIYHMFLTSIKTDRALYNLSLNPLMVSLGALTAEHYRLLFTDTLFSTWLLNSLAVSLSSTAISMAISILAAYGLTRIRFRGSTAFGIVIFITYLVPYSLLFLPLTRVVTWLNLADSLWALVVTYPTFLIPFSTWLLMGYMKTIPEEIEKSAMIDGCNRMRILTRIIIPLSVPGIVCATLFAFSLAWNDLLYSLVFISPTEKKTLTVGILTELIRGDVYFWGSLMGGALIGSVPVVVFYVLFMDYYVSGMTAGAIK